MITRMSLELFTLTYELITSRTVTDNRVKTIVKTIQSIVAVAPVIFIAVMIDSVLITDKDQSQCYPDYTAPSNHSE